MINRAIWIILDSVGMGDLPDSERFGDKGCNTIGHVAEKMNGLKLPNMVKLGLGNIEGMINIDKTDEPIGSYGKSLELSNGKDTTTGHWEMIGINSVKAFPTYPEGFSERIINEFINRCNIPGILGNCAASGTEIMDLLGEEHMKTKKPIVYTSADSVFQIACHEDIYSNEELYNMCKIARDILSGDDAVARVIARPFVGKPDEFTRTANRRDFSITPPIDNLLYRMKEKGMNVVGIGKIEDIFAKEGITYAIHTKDNEEGMDKTLQLMEEYKDGLIFTNLVEFDSKWGHRNDYIGYGKGLEAFDIRLKEVLDKMTDTDILIINADHGCDPTTPGTDHTREYIPIIVYGRKLKAVNLGIRNTFADIGQTLSEIFGTERLAIGESFLNELEK